MSERMLEKKFEQINRIENPESITQTSIRLGETAMRFARVERAPRYEDGHRESDVEHSYMLALIAPELAAKLELKLDSGLMSQFAIVHDLVELKTNDVPTLLLGKAELQQKEDIEKIALAQLLEELPSHTAHMLERYEHQSEPEARFIRFVDKLLPLVVDIVGDGNECSSMIMESHRRKSCDECTPTSTNGSTKDSARSFPRSAEYTLNSRNALSGLYSSTKRAVSCA